MITPSKAFDANGLQFAWSASTIKMAETCLRYYQYTMIEQWHSKGKNVHLRFGGHYATALEHFHKQRALGASYDDAMRFVVREALEATWDRKCSCGGKDEGCEACGGDGVHEGVPWDSMDNLKTRGTLIRTIIWYLEQFREDAAVLISLSDGTPGVELSATLAVDNGIIFAAHLDRLVEYADDPYVMDQKTTKTTISSHYFSQYSPDTQMSMYTYMGKAVFHTPVKGVIIDAAQIMVGGSRFERGFTFRTDAQLAEWYDNTMLTIERARLATERNEFPMNPSACGNYGGCVFRAVCSRDPGVRNNFLRGDFDQGGGYDPLERR